MFLPPLLLLLFVCLCVPQTSYSFCPSSSSRRLGSTIPRRTNHAFGFARKEAGEDKSLENVIIESSSNTLESTTMTTASSSSSSSSTGTDSSRNSTNIQDNSMITAARDQVPSFTFANEYRKRPKMNLSWCERDNCHEDAMRERVVGLHNEIMFDHPATGQVAYYWSHEEEEKVKPIPSVLLLVKKNDEGLMKVAADAVKALTSLGDIKVMLTPEVAAKFSHYYSVDNQHILLFDPKPVPGFGGNHLPTDSIQYSSDSSLEGGDGVGGGDGDGKDENEDICNGSDGPDLICTLGGDGLLMHASNLFSGPCPPILCIAGGSLGFLTPFPRCEMVDAIRISLGLQNASEGSFSASDAKYENDFFHQSSSMLPHCGECSPQNIKDGKRNRPTFKFGANNKICLSMRMRLDCRVINREGVMKARFNVLNEVTIDRGSSPYLAALECFCDNVHLTTVQADGVIFSTPTGSTAYSMAAGGSVVHPAVPAILVTPICPHVLSFRSMVFPDHVVLRCYVPDDARADASVAFDGKHRRELHRGDSVQVQMSSYPVPTINRADHSSDWLTSLKRNFNFNTRARQSPL